MFAFTKRELPAWGLLLELAAIHGVSTTETYVMDVGVWYPIPTKKDFRRFSRDTKLILISL